MMFSENVKMAWASIRSARLRSALTMFGIIVGVSSVVTVASLGEGLKNQISGQVQRIGGEIRVIQPAKRQPQIAGSLIPQASLPTSSITEKEIATIRQTDGVIQVVPVGLVNADVSYDDKTNDEFSIFATTGKFSELLQQKVQFGGFFSDNELGKNYAVIGRNVADKLFNERVPTGKTIKVGGQDFLVIGVFENKRFQPVPYSINFNDSIVLPNEAAKKLSGGVIYYEVLAGVDKTKVEATTSLLKKRLSEADGGKTSLGVYGANEIVGSSDSIFRQVTLFVAGVALISLMVGGIGIMNIMFATVSERTREIGIRKAVGATNRQVMNQFMTEAVLLSVFGSILGVIVSLVINGVLRVLTDLQPAITPEIIGISVAVAAVTGILSGMLPAAKAARKDPIDALRYDR